MTKEEAINAMIESNPMFKRTLKRLMLFENGMGIRRFSEKAKMNLATAYNFLRFYGRKFDWRKRIRDNFEEKYQALIPLWDENATILENSKKIKKSFSTARLIAQRFNLKFSHHTQMSPQKTRRIKRIFAFKKKGVKDAEIARFLGYSRERIRQLVVHGKNLGLDK